MPMAHLEETGMTEPTKYGEGLHNDMPELNYHSDPAPEPSLSASVAKVLWNRSPLHAKWAHPRFNPNVLDDDSPSRAREIGTAAHKLILGRGRELVVIPSTDYRNKIAQEARRHAYETARAPILKPDLDAAKAIEEALWDQIKGTELEDFRKVKGHSEVTALWREGPVWCRSRFDWLPDEGEHLTFVDVKTTTGSAKAEDWAGAMSDMGADLQAAFYERGLKRVRPVKSAKMLFLVVEQDAPYAVSINQPSGEAMENANAAVQACISIWEQCLRSGEWPSYDKQTQRVDPPAWSRLKHENRILGYRNLLDVMRRWQAP